MEEIVKKTIENLEKNHIKCLYLENKESIFNLMDELIQDQSIVGIGGSTTLNDLGFVEYLRNRDITFLDRYKENLSPLELKQVFRQSFFSDIYLTGTNAITMQGELFNVDGRGNRVACMLYGPDRVIVVCGVNKIVKDAYEANDRVKKIAGPLNNLRLHTNNACTLSNTCIDCQSENRICRDYVLIKKPQKDRFTLILINDNLGY